MNIYLIGVFTSIFVYVALGVYAGKKVKNIEDYYVSGRNATTLFITGTMFASMLSTSGFLGDPAYCYTGNITTMILLNTLCACGYVIGPLFFGRYIRRAEVKTMPSYFWQRFNSKRIRRFAGIITVISLSIYLLSVIQGVSLLMETLTGYNNLTCLLISWFCIMFFTLYSGSKGVILTDTVMCIFFLLATIMAGPYVFETAGGIDNLITTLVNSPSTPQDLLTYHGNTNGGTPTDIIMYGFTMGIVWMITVGVSPWQAGRNLMAKNEHVIFRSGVLSALLTVFFLLYLYLIAVSVIPINASMEKPEQVLIWAAFELMPEFLGMMLLTGIMAAGLSSASTFLSVVSFSLTSDIFDIKFKNEATHLNFTRMAVLIVSLIALVFAYLNLSSIRIISWFASTIIAASWGYVAFASVWSKKLTERGAYFAMLGGFSGFIISKALNEFTGIPFTNFFDPFFIGIFVSILCGVLGSKGQIKSAHEIDFQRKLHIIPLSEISKKEYKIDRIYGWVMVLAGIAITTFFIKYWVLPYNEAMGIELFAWI